MITSPSSSLQAIMHHNTWRGLRRSRIVRALLSRASWRRLLLLFFVLSILEAQICQIRLSRAAHEFHRLYTLPVLGETAGHETPPSSSSPSQPQSLPPSPLQSPLPPPPLPPPPPPPPLDQDSPSVTNQQQQNALLTRSPRARPRVFIASLFWNNAALLHSEWIARAASLIRLLGPENVFVSAYESGSWDSTKEQLRAFQGVLDGMGVANRILMENVSHIDLLEAAPNPILVPTDQISIRDTDARGWIHVGPGNKNVWGPDYDQQRAHESRVALRRIPYLAMLRNLSLQPLKDLDAQGAAPFDYVLFLGDVVFSPTDALALLDTNGGEYAAACSLDFSNPPWFYDTFALRDFDGHEKASPIWPYFRSARSRDALKRSEPVPVASCWNGIVAMPASTFTGPDALAFRGIDDSLARAHLEGSECCLIHADNPASSQASRGVFLNPNVRVGYSRQAFDTVHGVSRSGEALKSDDGDGHEHGGGGGSWLSLFSIWAGLWLNRLARWFWSPRLKEALVRRTVARWALQNAAASAVVHEPGAEFCLVNEMHVLAWNGWAHF